MYKPWNLAITYSKHSLEKFMKEEIESRLETKATAALQKEIEQELEIKGGEKSVASLLETQEKKEEDLETTGECD